jgi:hypothetical protein
MLKPVQRASVRVAVVALYALAMLLVGVVSHDVSGEGGVAPGGTAIASIGESQLPNGEPLPICGHSDRDRAGDSVPPGQHGCCEACLLAHAHGLDAGVANPLDPPPRGAAPRVRLAIIARPDRPVPVPMSRGPPAV